MAMDRNGDSSVWMEYFSRIDREISTPKVVIVVSHPEQQGSLLSKYVTYMVHTDPLGFNVRRRFSDFEWLRTTLSARYVGLFLPPLPPKTVAAKVEGRSSELGSSEIIQLRMRLLNLFLNSLVSVPFLRDDESLIAFLSLQATKDWEKTQTLHSSPISEITTVGYRSWVRNLDEFVEPANSERMILDFKRQLDLLKEQFRLLEVTFKPLLDMHSEYLEQSLKFNNQIGILRQTESDFCNQSINEFPNRFNPSTILESLGACLTSSSSVEASRLDSFRLTLDSSLVYLKSAVDSMLTCIRHYEIHIRNDLPSLDGREDRRVEFLDLQKYVTLTTRALVFSEMDRFNLMRRDALNAMQAKLALSETESGQRLASAWVQLSQQQPYSPKGRLENPHGQEEESV